MRPEDQEPSPEAFKKWLLGDPDGNTPETRYGMLESRNLTIPEMAARAGISGASLYNYIAGITVPTKKSLAGICEALGVPYEEGQKYIKTVKPGRPFGWRKRKENIE